MPFSAIDEVVHLIDDESQRWIIQLDVVAARLGARDGSQRRARRAMVADKALDLLRPPSRLAVDGGRVEPGYGFHHVSLSTESATSPRGGRATKTDHVRPPMGCSAWFPIADLWDVAA